MIFFNSVYHVLPIWLGAYPCFCGAKDKAFGDRGSFNSSGPFKSLGDRLAHLEKTDTWHTSFKAGNIMPFNVMKVIIWLMYFANKCYETLLPEHFPSSQGFKFSDWPNMERADSERCSSVIQRERFRSKTQTLWRTKR